MNRTSFAGSGRWVVKIGSALLTAGGAGLDTQAIAAWVAQLAQLRAQGRQVVVVSSGAVAEGMRRLGWQTRPDAIHDLQAAAAVGRARVAGAERVGEVGRATELVRDAVYAVQAPRTGRLWDIHKE